MEYAGRDVEPFIRTKTYYNITKAKRALWLANSASTICPWVYAADVLNNYYNITKAKRALWLANSASTICPWVYAADVLNN